MISADHEIITGHTRFKAAKKLGLSSVPCVIADELTEEQIKAFRLVDNKVGELAEWDVDLLPLELADIAQDLSPFGFETISGGRIWRGIYAGLRREKALSADQPDPARQAGRADPCLY